MTKTQSQAEHRAKKIVANLGGGEVRIQGENAKWRDSDTVAPGRNPKSSKDKKHEWNSGFKKHLLLTEM